MVAIIVWIVRRLEAAFEEKERKGWLAKIPFNAVVNITGILLLFMVALFWALVVLWIQWRGVLPDLALLENPEAYWVVAQVLGVCLLLVISLAAPFDAAKYRDSYREKLDALIAAKLKVCR